MIPYSYNMVDMGGIDLAEANRTVVEGLYSRLALARNACGDLILYNWKFAEIEITPGICNTLDEGTSIVINGLIEVTEQDEVTVLGIAPPPVPVEPLDVVSNGVYVATPPASGFNPVSVNVPIPHPRLIPIAIVENGEYNPPAGVDGFNMVTVNVAGGLSASVGELFRHVMFSNSASDRVRRSDRWFQRNSGEPVLFLSAAFFEDSSMLYSGYSGISFSADGITGTNSTYGDLISPVQKTTPNGTIYYVQYMSGMYPPSTDSGRIRFMYASDNYEFVLVPSVSNILVDANTLDFIGSQDLISLMNSMIDSMYQEYYA